MTSIEETRAALLTRIEREYDGQTVMALAAALALAAHEETLREVNDLLEETKSPTHNIKLHELRRRIEALGDS